MTSTVSPIRRPTANAITLAADPCQRLDAGRAGRTVPHGRRTFLSWLGQRRGMRPRITGLISHGVDPMAWEAERKASARSSARPVRATYPSRAGLAAAICVSWSLAVVAGVLLIRGTS